MIKSMDKSFHHVSELEEIAGHYKVCTWLLLRLSRRESLLYKLQRCKKWLISCIFRQSTLLFCRFQSDQPGNHHGSCLSAWFWQFFAYIIGLDGIVSCLRFLPTYLSGLISWFSKPLGPLPAAPISAALSLQCWPIDKAVCGLTCHKAGSRISTAVVEDLFYRWGLGKVVIGPLPMLGLRGWALLWLPLLVRPVNNEKSENSHL